MAGMLASCTLPRVCVVLFLSTISIVSAWSLLPLSRPDTLLSLSSPWICQTLHSRRRRHISSTAARVVLTRAAARPTPTTTTTTIEQNTNNNREQLMDDDDDDQDKTEVRNYFNTEGFQRWNKIYSDSADVNGVQQDIRRGHAMTIEKILRWFDADADAIAADSSTSTKASTGSIAGQTVCDCGCGVGSLAIPMAQRGAFVSASDISDSMTREAERRSAALGIETANFFTSDLEHVAGTYRTVTCVDVAIHYPDEKMKDMVGHLCSLAEERVILSFAPKTWYYELLKKVGELFPGPSKTTRAYLHEESFIRDALTRNGFAVTRDDMTATNFYFSRLLEAKRVS